MSVVHAAISAVLLFWQSVWHHLLGGADVPWLLGIVFLVLTVRTLLLPLIVRQVRSQRAAQALQPRIQELRSRHTDPAALQRELVALHRAEKVPLAGLLPLLIQAPVFLGLPLSLLASGAIFPIGVLLSWVTQNLFVLGQQAWLLRRYPPPAAQVQ